MGFRDSASRILKHYRTLVEDVEVKAKQLTKMKIEEEVNKHNYFDNHDWADCKFEKLFMLNRTDSRREIPCDIMGCQYSQTSLNARKMEAFISNINVEQSGKKSSQYPCIKGYKRREK